jgi:hypothetical protein
MDNRLVIRRYPDRPRYGASLFAALFTTAASTQGAESSVNPEWVNFGVIELSCLCKSGFIASLNQKPYSLEMEIVYRQL